MLKDVYKKFGAIGAYVAFQKLFNMQFTNNKALAYQINTLIKACAYVNNTDIMVNKQLFMLLVTNSFLQLYQSITSTILNTIANVKTLKTVNICICIAEEEQHYIASYIQIACISKVP